MKVEQMFAKHMETELTRRKKKKVKENSSPQPPEGTLIRSIATPGKKQMLCSLTLGKK